MLLDEYQAQSNLKVKPFITNEATSPGSSSKYIFNGDDGQRTKGAEDMDQRNI